MSKKLFYLPDNHSLLMKRTV